MIGASVCLEAARNDSHDKKQGVQHRYEVGLHRESGVPVYSARLRLWFWFLPKLLNGLSHAANQLDPEMPALDAADQGLFQLDFITILARQIKEYQSVKIWVDIATSPQVLFLRPIIAELRGRGHELLITTRNSTETVPLADRLGLSHTVVGSHGGRTMLGKTGGLSLRAAQLARIVRRQHISLALSHGSYSQAMAAYFLGIPLVTCTDYEGHPANHVLCRVAKKILVPNLFDPPSLYRFGASPGKVESYGGLKEDVYLADFVPNPGFAETAGIPSHNVVVTMRPPSLVAAYHRFKNPLFDELLTYVLSHPNTFVVLVPRGSEQRRHYEQMQGSRMLVPAKILDGPDLVYHSDLVIGAGGTMNREAAALGIRVYTVFKGAMGSVDKHLIASGRMVRIESKDDFASINLCKKVKSAFVPRDGRRLLSELVDKIEAVRAQTRTQGYSDLRIQTK
ncbi:MAG TPA: DUF354 domain-containing protein [Acidobacteriaceae bacterium]|nr:DUF354 domain-containing protein [Acidobacteriaceae bacterium]